MLYLNLVSNRAFSLGKKSAIQCIDSLVCCLCLSDVSTKHSQECCVKLVEEGGLRVIFGVLTRCNRSLPNQLIIAKTCSILLNVAKV